MDPSRYFVPDKPCRRGHSLRRVADRVCVSCEQVRLKRWKDGNRDHVRQRDRAQRAKDPEKIRAQGRAQYAANPEKRKASVSAHYERNSEKIRARRRAYHHKTYPECEEIRLVAQARTVQWAKDNPERARANGRNGKARRRSVPGTHTAEDIERIFNQQKGRCAYCRKRLDGYHVDHITARDPIHYAQILGRLL